MITQKKVAEYVGLAPRTVANILSGRTSYRYSEETKKRVLEAAEKLGYRVNRLSRAVRKGRSNLIGIINFSSIAETAQKTEALLPRIINAEGFDYMSIDLNWHGGDIDRVIDELIQARVEGVLVSHMTPAFGRRYTDMLTNVGIPAVVIYGDDQLQIPLIADDTRAAFYAMTRHIQSIGHKRLFLLVNDYDARPAKERIVGFQFAMEGYGPCETFSESQLFLAEGGRLPWAASESGIILKVSLARFGYNPILGYYETAKRLLTMGGRPDAIIGFNDMAAFGVFTAALEIGMKIPSDIAVTGSDKDLFGAFGLYNLTTIEKDLDRACTAAVELLVARIRNIPVDESNRLFASNLILRGSCGRMSAGQPEAQSVVPIPPLPNSITSVAGRR